jgi:sarcosine oxidase
VHVTDFFNKTLAAARRFGIAHEVLDAADIRRRFPVFKVKDDEQGYFEPRPASCGPKRASRTQLALAARLGADLHAASACERSRSAATRWS